MKILKCFFFMSVVCPIFSRRPLYFGQKPQKRLDAKQPFSGNNPLLPEYKNSPYTSGTYVYHNQNLVCSGHDTCCCVERRLCQSKISTHSGGGIIDVRVLKPDQERVQGRRCQQGYGRDEVYCCTKGGDPHPPVESKPVPLIQNPHCLNNDQCCCINNKTCQGTDQIPKTGGGFIDIKFNPSRNTRLNRKCGNNKLWCCIEEYAVEGPYHPEPTYPPQSPGTVYALNEPCGIRGSYIKEIKSTGYGQGGPNQASLGEFPWLVVILTAGGHFLGSGAILDEWTILTADHRVFELDYINQRIKVRAGEWDTADEPTPVRYKEADVSYISHHESSNVRKVGRGASNLKYNVAVVHLKTKLPIRKSPFIKSVCLPNPGANFDNNRCWVAGWGVDEFKTNRYQIIPKKLNLPVLPATECSDKLKQTRLGPDFEFDDYNFICAGGSKDIDTCTGDGGAPLVCGSDYKYYVAGIVAWGIGCGKTGIPGVYTNVASFASFINEERKQGPKPYYGPRQSYSHL